MRVLVRRQGIPGDRPEWVEEVSPQGSRRFRNTNPPEHDPGARRFLVMFNEGDQNFHATVYALDVPDLQRKLKEDKIRRIYGIEELPPHTVESPDMVMVVNAKGERFESAAEKEPRMLLGSNLYEIDQRAYRKVVGDDRIVRYEPAPDYDEALREVLEKKLAGRSGSYGLTVLEIDLNGRSSYDL